MAKGPTFFQTLLGRPSQSYAFPQQTRKERYHSTKQQLIQIASDAARETEFSTTPAQHFDDSRPSSSQDDYVAELPPRAQDQRRKAYADDEEPSWSGSVSSGSGRRGSSSRTRPSSVPGRVQIQPDVIHSSDAPTSFPSYRRSRSSQSSVEGHVEGHVELATSSAAPTETEQEKEFESEDEDVFYTPSSSPHTSMAIDASVDVLIHKAFSSFNPKTTSRPDAAQAAPEVTRSKTMPSRRPLPQSTHGSTTSLTSVTTLTTSASDNMSIFSGARSASTRITSPRHSNASLPSSAASSRRSATYTDEDWVQEVRWLVAPQAAQPKPTKKEKSKRRATIHQAPPMADLPAPAPPLAPSTQGFQVHPVAPRRSSKHAHRRSAIVSTSSSGRGMSALLEEDEDEVQSLHRQASRSRVASMGATPPRPPGQPRVRVASTPSNTSASLSRASSVTSTGTNINPISAPHALSRNGSASSRGSSKASSSKAPSSKKYGTAASHVSKSQTYATAPAFLPTLIPASSTAGALPSSGTAGYTSLTLPRAGYKPTKPSAGGAVDLTLGGLAQTTMASVEIVRGAAGKIGGSSGGLFRRKRTTSMGRPGGGGDALAFTSHRAPPTYVPSRGVLVQVWAVGVDGIDGRLVCEKAGEPSPVSTASTPANSRSTSIDEKEWKKLKERERKEEKEAEKGRGKVEVGFIPGRSLVGRVLECGWDVKEDVCRKGDWVVGLLDVRKCGALTEFVVVDRHRVVSVPYPRMTEHSFLRTLPTPPPSPPLEDEELTLAELALLPVCGIPAYRAVRTIVEGPNSRALQTQALAQAHAARRPPVRDASRVLILAGHTGAGALAVQMLAAHAWRVCVHIPAGAAADDAEEEALEERVLALGAEDVVFDDGEGVCGVLDRLTAEGQVFDAVLDTVGGRDVWEAAEALLVAGGRNAQFTTLVGDVRGRAVPSAGDHFRAGLRSMGVGGSGHGAGGNVTGAGKIKKSKGRGTVRYAWVSVEADVDFEGENVRDSLLAVVRLARGDGIKPVVSPRDPIPFERSPEVLGALGNNTAVVRIVG